MMKLYIRHPGVGDLSTEAFDPHPYRPEKVN